MTALRRLGRRLSRTFLVMLLRASRRALYGDNYRAAVMLLRVAARMRRTALVLARLGRAASLANDFTRAIRALTEAASAINVRPSYQVFLGNVYSALGYPASAAARFRAALAIDPQCAQAYIGLSYVLRAEGRDDDALAELLNAPLCTNAPPRILAVAFCALADIYKDRADRARTIDCCLRALMLDASCVEAYFQLAHLGFYQYQDIAHAHVRRMEQLVQSRKLPKAAVARLRFALGHIYDAHHDEKQAFLHFRIGNELRRARFRRNSLRNDADRRIKVFTRQRIEELSHFGSPHDGFVFIVGMPRSGTTLVEQIIDSHPLAAGLGERVDIFDATRILQRQLKWSGCLYPECIEYLNADLVRAMSNSVRTAFTAAAPQAKIIATKRPDDAWELGLIHILFPKSQVLHCRRHPVDACLSCFMQDFRIPYAARLKDLAEYYRQYLRITAHWRSVLPASVFHEVNYERLVESPEESVNNILAACRLDFAPECLAFFNNPRRVDTASVWQVREPLNSMSIGRWERYREFLGALEAILPAGWPTATSGRTFAARETAASVEALQGSAHTAPSYVFGPDSDDLGASIVEDTRAVSAGR